jgi:succinate dehydrogenase / fumarate reductase cytochrome b subunit
MQTANQQVAEHQPQARNWWKWFYSFPHSISTWGFTLNRVTALGLTFYLYLHLIVLGQLAMGPNQYDNFLAILHSPVVIFAEWLVVAAGFIHGLNGVRILLNSFGVAIPRQRALLIGLLSLAAVISLVFLVRMFTA